MPPEGTRWPAGGYAGMPFQRILAEAIADMAAHGYSSRERFERWLELLRHAAERDLGPDAQIDEATRRILGDVYRKLIERGGVAQYVPGVERFTLTMIRPELRAELDRRILAAADLIKLHRREAIERTLQRFQGWSTSIPPGGDGTIDKRETRASIGKSVAQYKFEKRRVDVDQSFKLIANISEIVATDQGAIAGIWHDHGEHDPRYNARKDHLARSGHVFLVRDSWAIQEGLIKRGSRPYMDEVTKPGVEPFCRCWYQWILSPRRLPDQCLTKKGQEWVAAGAMRAAA